MKFNDLITTEQFRTYYLKYPDLRPFSNLPWGEQENWRQFFCELRLEYAKGKVYASLTD